MRFINVSFPSIGLSQELSKKVDQAAQKAVNSTAIALRDNWQQIGQSTLNESRQDYINAIQVSKPDKFTADLRMEGTLPKMLEDGFPSFDMKLGFSNSQYAKHGKDGQWYLTIPFRHLTPSHTGAAPKWNTMPKDIYKNILKHSPLHGTENKYPATVSWTGYHHKNGIYEGMIRNKRTAGGGSTYFTFRRVSEKSAFNSWMHPGYVGVHAVDQLVNQVGSLFEKTFNYYLSQNQNGNDDNDNS